jgi:hypothetical protein
MDENNKRSHSKVINNIFLPFLNGEVVGRVFSKEGGGLDGLFNSLKTPPVFTYFLSPPNWLVTIRSEPSQHHASKKYIETKKEEPIILLKKLLYSFSSLLHWEVVGRVF